MKGLIGGIFAMLLLAACDAAQAGQYPEDRSC